MRKENRSPRKTHARTHTHPPHTRTILAKETTFVYQDLGKPILANENANESLTLDKILAML